VWRTGAVDKASFPQAKDKQVKESLSLATNGSSLGHLLAPSLEARKG
jgi:hypothetical protein